MKKIQVIHNAKAGDGQFSETELVSLIESKGFKCLYTSTEETKWKVASNIDYIAVAGGDGTVRELVKKLLKDKQHKQYPIALLPLGTANNIGKSLHITGNVEAIIEAWHKGHVQDYDIGKIKGVKDHKFFLESFGCGLLPILMKEMKKYESNENTAKKEKEKALEVMRTLASQYKAKKYKIEIDGKDYSGTYFMAEIMNINSIGPNLHLNAGADISDGKFEVVLIPDTDRAEFIEYLDDIIASKNVPLYFNTIKAKKIDIQWKSHFAHADDELIATTLTEAKISISKKPLQFLVSANAIH